MASPPLPALPMKLPDFAHEGTHHATRHEGHGRGAALHTAVEEDVHDLGIGDMPSGEADPRHSSTINIQGFS